jgi:hypothetical protein
MVLVLSIFFLYFMNISILFQNQSLVVFFSFWIILYYLNNKYVHLKSTTFQFEILEWLEIMQFFMMIKNWSLLLIRLLNVTFFNFYKFIMFMKNELIYLLSDVFSIVYNFYKNNVYKCAFWNLDRLVSTCKSLESRKLDLTYLLTLY